MARGVVSLLSLFLLSASASTGFAFSFQHILLSSSPREARPYHHDRTRLHMTPFQHAVAIADEDRLRVEGVGGAERARLAESIAQEFRAQTAVIKAACEAEMEQQRAAHTLDLAQQRVTLLEVRVGVERAGGKTGCVRGRVGPFGKWGCSTLW